MADRARAPDYPTFKGVAYDRGDGKFRVRISISNKRIFLGKWSDPAEAARAYDRAAVMLFGHTACTNFGAAAAQADEGSCLLRPDIVVKLQEAAQQLAVGTTRAVQRQTAPYRQQQAAMAQLAVSGGEAAVSPSPRSSSSTGSSGGLGSACCTSDAGTRTATASSGPGKGKRKAVSDPGATAAVAAATQALPRPACCVGSACTLGSMPLAATVPPAVYTPTSSAPCSASPPAWLFEAPAQMQLCAQWVPAFPSQHAALLQQQQQQQVFGMPLMAQLGHPHSAAAAAVPALGGMPPMSSYPDLAGHSGQAYWAGGPPPVSMAAAQPAYSGVAFPGCSMQGMVTAPQQVHPLQLHARNALQPHVAATAAEPGYICTQAEFDELLGQLDQVADMFTLWPGNHQGQPPL